MKLNPSENIPTRQSTSQEWLDWFDELDSRYGASAAKDLFVLAWNKRGSTDVSNVDFRAKLKDKGITIPETFGQSAADSVHSSLDFFGDIFKMGAIGSVAMAVFVMILIMMILRAILRDPTRSAQIAANFTPQGRAYNTARLLSK